jgi:hypothetical protein
MEVTSREAGGAVEVRLAGVISERSQLHTGRSVSGRRVVVDVGAVKNINSFGVRTWVNFLHDLCAHATEVTIQRMPPVLVNQAGMVANFLGRARVESFFSPWCCVECDHEQLELHPIDAELPAVYRCPECDGEMEFDGLRDTYLSFREGLQR